MPSIACENCGQQVSDQAKACPACGHPQPGATHNRKLNWFAALLIVVALVIGGSAWYAKHQRDERVNDLTSELVDIYTDQ